MEPRTRHLLAIDLFGGFDYSFQIINEIEKQNKGELRYVFSTKDSQLNDQTIETQIKWKKQRPNLQFISSGIQSVNKNASNKNQLKDLQTLELGDICICCLESPGHTLDSVSLVITHVTPESTKIPFLFTGNSLEIGGCGKIIEGTADQMFYSLQKLINLPNETLVFNANENSIENLRFAKLIEPENPMIDFKLKQCQKAIDSGDFTVPSKLMDERLYNPFIKCARDDYFSNITGESDPVRIFAKLRKLRDNFQ
ncbi:UNKNOWN [Stylonychia lemnae]|uniref:Hydroxyacylglutathione hydrolase C-terminal domain-containing protein n=1 Tax=Stylonychia lemnae TaxID=5949 RepID=A0A078AMV1_STYLE|nr:UNKNOWN [Stylonychia lemnae]|eukprot:CDW82208.1 UNKNOWN [Stylonychia lemnae]